MQSSTSRVGRRFAACAALLCAVAAAPRAFAEDAPEPERPVRSIEWVGAESLDQADLERAILTSKANWRPWVEDRPVDPGTLEQDVARVERLYERHGFYHAAVEASSAPGSRGGVVVTFRVSEGERVGLASFELELARPGVARSPLDAEVLRPGLALVVGEPFSVDRYEQAKRELLERLAEAGYPAAQVRGGAVVRLEENGAAVAWTLDPGPFVTLGAAEVHGLERVAEHLVLGEVAWQEGEPYSRAVLRRTQRAVFALDQFRSVGVQVVPPDPLPTGPDALEQHWPVSIEVHERSPRAFRVGVGYGTEDSFRTMAEWKHRNFLGGLRTLRLRGKYSGLERGVESVCVQPRFLDRKTTLSLDVLWSQETEPAFDTSGVSTGWRLERPFAEHWSARLGQRFELREVTNVEATETVVGLKEDESFRLLTFELGVRRSTLDSELDPTRGTWLDLGIEPSFSALGSEVDYVKLMAETRAFHPLPWRMVLAGRARLGTLEPFGGDGAADIPIFKRFFSGGSTSVRGFDLDGLGPIESDGDPLGGLTLAEASVELRYPIWRDLGGVVFVDGGQVALRSFTLRADDFYFSTGVGLRYKTPIGPLRFDVARILNPPNGVDAFGFYFSVGHAF